jgi:hypothetical protein
MFSVVKLLTRWLPSLQLLLWEAVHRRRFVLFATVHGTHSLVAKQVAAFKLDDDAGQLEDALACSLGLVLQSLAVSSALSITEARMPD